MFENLDSKKNDSSSGSVGKISLSGAAPAPGGRGGFSPASAPAAPKVEDMFADIKDMSAVKPKIGGAAKPNVLLAPTEKPASNILRNLLIIIIVLVMILAAIFLASRFVGSAGLKNLGEQISNLKSLVIKDNKPGATVIVNNEKPAVPEDDGTEVENNNVIPPANSPMENIPAENNPSVPPAATSTVATPPAPAVDIDGDGLLDSEEAVLKTNPLKADSDDDGLTDYQEVKIYLTDPLKADTDGDTYLDGAEVKSGYNPNGPGKLGAQ